MEPGGSETKTGKTKKERIGDRGEPEAVPALVRVVPAALRVVRLAQHRGAQRAPLGLFRTPQQRVELLAAAAQPS